jgi:hypothetical protein
LVNLNLNYALSNAQRQMFAECTAKYNAVAKGRRLGFTKGFAIYVIKQMLQGVSPILWGDTVNGNIDRYQQRYFLPLLKQLGPSYYVWNQMKRELRLVNVHTADPRSAEASICDFRSADRPENWEGFGYQLIILNEAGIILRDPYLYNNAVLPMLLDFPDSRLIAGGVPKGRYAKDGNEHPFYQISQKAKAGDKRYKLFEFSSFDNPLLSAEDVQQLIQDLGGEESPYVQQEVYGKFVDYNGKPFFYAFKREKHVSEEAVYQEGFDLHVCLDFNIDNTATCIQGYGGSIHVIDEFRNENWDLEMTLQAVKERYPEAFLVINGDASGKAGSALTQGNESAYQIVKRELDLSWNNFNVPAANPSHLNSYVLTNNILKRLDFKIHPLCVGVIRDFEQVTCLQKNGKLRIDKSDESLTHYSDTVRYYCWAEHQDQLKRK